MTPQRRFAVQPAPEGETAQECVARLIREHGPPPKRITDLVTNLRAQTLEREARTT